MGGQPARAKSAKIVRPKIREAFPLRVAAIVLGFLLVVATAAFLLVSGGGSDRMQTVVVAPGDRSPNARALARDLLVDLGHLQAARADRLRLVAQSEEGVKSDLIFEAAAAGGPGGIGANLVLLSGNDRSLLWSRDFKQASRNHADLRQQVAFTAARILGCASEGLGAEGHRLDPATLKQYLNVCAQLAEIDGDGARSAIPALTEIVEKAPRFEAAWAQLLLAESEASRSTITGRDAEADAIRLRARIAALRRINAASPAIAIVEALLLPPRDFAKRLALLNRSVGETPDNVLLLAERSRALGSVGRLRESMEDAARAANLEPLSPVMRDGHISALLYGGQTDAALHELRKAEQLWPGTESVEQMRYRYHLRFGDPQAARRMSQGRALGYLDLFLTARANPSRENVDRMIDYMWDRVRSGEEAPANVSGLSIMMQALGQFGRTDELYELFSAWKSDEDLSIVSDLYFRPALRSFIRDPRFMGIATRAGLIDYWQTSGKWPDFCFEPGWPYDCKMEAAKLS